MQDMDWMRQFLSAPGLGRKEARDSALVGVRSTDFRASGEYKSSQRSVLLGGKPVSVVGDGRASKREICGAGSGLPALEGTFN